MLSKLVEAASEDLLLSEDEDSEQYTEIIDTLNQKLKTAQKKLLSYRRKSKVRDKTLKDPAKLATKLVRTQKSINNNLDYYWYED
jgi:hypothetical protein